MMLPWWRKVVGARRNQKRGNGGPVLWRSPRPLPPRVEELETRTLLSTSLPLNTTSWTAIGPTPILNGQTPGNLPVSGRITAIAADPTNASNIYIASAGGGVWKTTNGGTSWTALTDAVTTPFTQAALNAGLTDTQVPLFMGAIAMAPTNPSIIYVGTGEADGAPDAYYGEGVLKSTDGGNTWTLLGTSQFARRSIAQIVVDPTNANTVYVAVGTAGTNGLSGNTGVWKSTDGGVTWARSTFLTDTQAYTDLVIDPTNPQTLYTAVGTFTGSGGNGVYKTTNGGTTWNPAGNFPNGSANGNIRLALAKSSHLTLYASVASPTTFGLFKMLTSTDGGTTWTATTGTPPNYLGTTGNYASTLAVDPSNASIVYAGGQGGTNSFLESTDGGTTWTDISTGGVGNNGPHANHHAIGFDANGKLLDGNDGGIWRLNPASGSMPWTDLNSNLSITLFNGVGLNPTSANVALGGTQGNGTNTFNDSVGWTQTLGGDGGYTRFDPRNPSTIYAEMDGISLQRSDDGGVTWNAKTTGINSSDPSDLTVPYVIDPSAPFRLLLGTNRVYLSSTHGDSWTPISTPNTAGWNSSAAIDALAIAPTSGGQTIYATAGGKIFVTTNGGTAWTERDVTGFTDHFACLAVDPTNSQIAYAVRDRFSTFSAGHVFRTINGGATWTDISAGLPNVPTYTLMVDARATPTVLYVGTDTGVYTSTNLGVSWARFGTSLPNVQVRELTLNPALNILAAATHGRGVWEIIPTSPLTVWTAQGPAPITNAGTEGLDNQSNPAIGAVQAIAADPTNPDRVFIGTVSGGIWGSTNATSSTPTWTPLTDQMPSLAIGDLAMSPVNTNVLYAGTGNFTNGGLPPTGALVPINGTAVGVLRSTDGGNTWTVLGQNMFNGQAIRSIVPTSLITAGQVNTQVVLAGTFSNPNAPSANDGLYRSTNGGLTWGRISGAGGSGLPNGSVPDILADPGDPTGMRCYAAVAGQGIFKSTNGGLTWSSVNSNIPTLTNATFLSGSGNIRMSIHNDASNNVLDVGFVTVASDQAVRAGQVAGVFQSTNQGTSWTSLGVPSDADGGVNPGQQGEINFCILADQTSPTVVFVGGDAEPVNAVTMTFPNAAGCNLFSGRHARWTGSAWVITDGSLANLTSAHADSRAMAFDANGNILEADDGGIYRLVNPDNDGTRIWTSVIGNLSNTEFYSVAYDDVNHTFFGGAQDVGSPEQFTAGSPISQDVTGGDGALVAVDNTSMPGFSIHYSSSTFLQVFQTRVFNNLGLPVSTTQIQLNGVDVNDLQFTTPTVLNAVDPTRMLIGGVAHVYESLDQGNDAISVATPTSAVSAIAYGGRLTGTANPDVAYIGTQAGQLLLRTTSGGAFNPLGAYMGGQVQAIALDPDNWQRAYVVGANSQIYLTTNAGTSFIPITANLGTLTSNVFTLALVDPTPGSVPGDEEALVGGLGGVFALLTPGVAGATWSPVGTGLPHVVVDALQYDAVDKVLVAATYGRGVWETKVAANHFRVTATPSSTAGSAFSVTVTALDPLGNVDPTYRGTVHFTSTDTNLLAVLPADYTFTAGDNGVHIFTNAATLVTAGLQDVTATDKAAATITGCATLSVTAAAATHFTIAIPPTATAGVSVPAMVVALDAFNNAAGSYSGKIHFTSTDGQASFPTDPVLGSGSFIFTFQTAGLQTVTGTDTMISSITGTSNVTTVSAVAGAASQFTVSAPATATAGMPFNVVVTARDASNNVATGYTGMVHLASTDPQFVPPANMTLINGVGTFSATLDTAGNQTVTAMDSVNMSITGTSAVIAVSPAGVSMLILTAPANAIAGAGFLLQVVAQDGFHNTATSYNGTVHFTSTDPQAAAPASNLTLSGGVGYTVATLKTASNQTITATDTMTPALTSTSNPITVSPAAAAHFAVSTPASAVTGSAFNFTVTAQDAFNNPVPTYTGNVHLTSTDGAAAFVPNPYTFQVGDAGVHSFSATLNTSGSQTITATDTAATSITGTSTAIASSGLTVQSVTVEPYGFVVAFDKAVDLGVLNLYDGPNHAAPDLTLVGSANGAIEGSAVFNPSNNSLTFLYTFGMLLDDAYTLTLVSGANAFRDLAGVPLDGNNDGVNGDNYTTTFTTNFQTTSVGLVVPPFARGPAQTVSLVVPFSSPSIYYPGLPIQLSDGNNATTAAFTLTYNTALLNVTAAAVDTSVNYRSAPTGSTFSRTSHTVVSGIATDVFAFSTNGNGNLGTGNGPVTIGDLTAAIPNTAGQMIYKAKEILDVTGVSVTGTLPGVGVDGTQVVAYLADASGDGAYAGNDSSLVGRVAGGQDTGFSAFPLLDPVILADVAGEGTVTANGASQVGQIAVHRSVPNITVIPAGAQVAAAGPDPALSLPANLRLGPGGTVTVPVNIDDPHPAGSTGLTEATLALRFDPLVFTVSAADIHLGAVPSGGVGWTFTSVVDAATGQLAITLYSLTPIASAAGGSLVTVDFHARSSAPLGATTIWLAASASPNGQVYRTNLADDHGALTLTPAPSDDPAASGIKSTIMVAGGSLSVGVLHGGTPTVVASYGHVPGIPWLSASPLDWWLNANLTALISPQHAGGNQAALDLYFATLADRYV
jgi:hypothetical protein